ncbi:MAG: nickel-dependent hydrogenase large subunit [Candidatus Acidiferrum sp.]
MLQQGNCPAPHTFRHGVDRRAFFKVVAQTTPAIGLTASLAAEVVAAVEKGARPSVNKPWDLLVKNIASGDAKIYNKPQFGNKELHSVGFHEAPRGTLSHWVGIKDGQIANYQAVVPTTWNAGARDENGSHGPYPLLGNPVADAERPLEVLRTVHSFDPCLACAIHTVDPEGKKLIHVS